MKRMSKISCLAKNAASALLVTVYLVAATASADCPRRAGGDQTLLVPARTLVRVPEATIHRTVQYIGGDARKILEKYYQ